jgi:hypothetical protein
MAPSLDPPIQPAEHRLGYRLVVRARTPGRRTYFWQIFHEEALGRPPVAQSPGSFRSMEEAYADGTTALEQVRAPQRDVAQSPR